MKLSKELPPNIEEIAKYFPFDPKHTVFTYGDTLYNVHDDYITEDLRVHEETHVRQQKEHMFGPEGWWEDYMTNAEFRLEQEIEAYRNQYRKFCKMHKNREECSRFLFQISRDLSGPMYGKIVNVAEALRQIKL